MNDDVLKTHGAVSWTELLTNDVEAAKAFYGTLFGWRFQAIPMGDDGDYFVIQTGDRQIGGIMRIPEQAKNAAPHWGSYVTVDDLDAAIATATAQGGALLQGPNQVPECGRYALLRDPQGATIHVFEYGG